MSRRQFVSGALACSASATLHALPPAMRLGGPLIDAVKPKRTFLSIEMMPWSFPSGPDEYVRLIKAVDRQAFGVHLDVCCQICSEETSRGREVDALQLPTHPRAEFRG